MVMTMNEYIDNLLRLLDAPPDALHAGKNHEYYLKITSGDACQKAVAAIIEQKGNLIDLFCVEAFETDAGLTLFYAFEMPRTPDVLILRYPLAADSAQSIAQLCPIASLYEREIHDGFGVSFEGAFDARRLFLHEMYPKDLHPLRKSFVNAPLNLTGQTHETYQFKEFTGEGVYQIPVGPVHAGIIEPGHFRFSVIGEQVFNLEIRHCYKHRGLEKQAEGKTPEDGLKLAEAVSGDETVANAMAYCLAVESFSGISIPERALALRAIFAELERMYALLGDTAGMVVDVAYPVGASAFFILREELFRQNERLTGSRFMKGALRIGGVARDVAAPDLEELNGYLRSFTPRLRAAERDAVSHAVVFDRFETTGVVKPELVAPLGLSGPVARAAGVELDTRVNHPYNVSHPHNRYAEFIKQIKTQPDGDVLCRFKLKVGEIAASAEMIQQQIAKMPGGAVCSEQADVRDGYALALVESARGQNAHWVYLKDGQISRYKVKTASFCNWLAMEHATPGNIVPDFPLINKSMNLSYAGNDL